MIPETSGFQIIIGEVELGPRPELLDLALPLSQVARVLVTDEVQTIILTESSSIRLDWSRWVTEVLGESAGNANYTLRRTQLDESGNPISPPQMVEPTDPESRIVYKFDPETDEFYVDFSRVVAIAGAEDPDRAIYELEACVPQPDGSVRCYRSNITVYAIDIPPGSLHIAISLL